MTKKNSLTHIPGDKGLPIIGILFQFLEDPMQLVSTYEKQYGKVYRSQYLNNERVTLLGPGAHKFLLVDNVGNVTSKEAWQLPLGKLFPNGLMLMDGDKHKYHRNIIRQAFTKAPMQGYLELMKPIVDRELDIWEQQPEFRVFDALKSLTLQVAGTVFFGIDFKDDVNKVNSAIVDIVKAALAIPINLPFTTYGKGLKARQFLVTYFMEVIEQKRQNPGKDLFSMLCHAKSEEGDQFDDQQVIDHLIFILMAAHDTTASATTSWIYEMGKNTNWQQSVRQEILETPIHSNQNEVIALSQYPKLNNTISEVLRMHPPLITLPRFTQCPIHYNGYDIPENTNVSVVLQHSHYLEEIWSDPMRFDPQRFERKEQSRCPHAYAPFGAGQHHCVGYMFAEMEMRLIMTSALRRFHWKFDEHYNCDFSLAPLTMPKDGLPIKMQPNTNISDDN